METYVSPSLEIVHLNLEASYATSPGFSVPDGEDNGNDNNWA